MKTNYGFRIEGTSRFIFVAPHAGGDDARTKELSEDISRQINSFIVMSLRD